jgi:hypothetical protein
MHWTIRWDEMAANPRRKLPGASCCLERTTGPIQPGEGEEPTDNRETGPGRHSLIPQSPSTPDELGRHVRKLPTPYLFRSIDSYRLDYYAD